MAPASAARESGASSAPTYGGAVRTHSLPLSSVVSRSATLSAHFPVRLQPLTRQLPHHHVVASGYRLLCFLRGPATESEKK